MTILPLLDDCFLHDRDRMRHDDAVALLRARIATVAKRESVSLNSASGRILASAIAATHNVPLHTNAAVDGYAFQHPGQTETSDARLTFEVSGRAAAGVAAKLTPSADQAVRIFTGAVLPTGTDTVVMQEDVTRDDTSGQAHVSFGARINPGSNVRHAGEDVACGSVLFNIGHVIRPQDLAALASVGIGAVDCYAKLRVAIVSTGDEIIAAGSRPLQLGEVFDANTPMLEALARSAHVAVTSLGVWPDTAATVQKNLLDAATKFDVILTSGGASRGDEDHMVSALDAVGKRHLWQLAIKPGRPMSFGQIGNTVVVGLPGNPVAVFVCFLMYVWPMLRRLGGGAWPEPRRLQLPANFEMIDRKTGRREFLRGFLSGNGPDTRVEKFPRDGSGLISGLRAATGLIDIPEDVPGIQIGDPVAFLPLDAFGIVS